MTSDELIAHLADSLQGKAAADASLQPLLVREEIVAALEMGSAIEGHIDFSPLREHLLEKGASGEVIESTLGELGTIATSNGFALVEGLFHEASPDDKVAAILEAGPRRAAPVADGFLPAAEIQKERDNMDRQLVSVAVRNSDLESVDLDQFRDALYAALDAATSTGTLDLGGLWQFLRGAGAPETVCHETILTMAAVGAPGYSGPGKSRYQIVLPPSLSALDEAQRRAILDGFNKRFPVEAPAAKAAPRPPKEKKDEKVAAPVPGLPPTEKPVNKPLRRLIAVAVVAALLGGGYFAFGVKPQFKDVGGSFQSPAGGMPCSMLLAQHSLLYCGITGAKWRELAKANATEIANMKKHTEEAARNAGYSQVQYGPQLTR